MTLIFVFNSWQERPMGVFPKMSNYSFTIDFTIKMSLETWELNNHIPQAQKSKTVSRVYEHTSLTFKPDKKILTVIFR